MAANSEQLAATGNELNAQSDSLSGMMMDMSQVIMGGDGNAVGMVGQKTMRVAGFIANGNGSAVRKNKLKMLSAPQ